MKQQFRGLNTLLSLFSMCCSLHHNQTLCGSSFYKDTQLYILFYFVRTQNNYVWLKYSVFVGLNYTVLIGFCPHIILSCHVFLSVYYSTEDCCCLPTRCHQSRSLSQHLTEFSVASQELGESFQVTIKTIFFL